MIFSCVIHSNAQETATGIKVIGGGLKKGIFFTPTYLNVEGQRLYVSDSYLNRIQAFIRGNVFQLGFGSFGQNQKEFDTIGGVCSIDDKLFVVDTGNGRIQTIDSKGSYLSQLKGRLEQPVDICTNGTDMFILDNALQSVFVNDILFNLGENRQLVAIDYANNSLYISDYKNGEILIMKTDGHWKVFSKEVKKPLGMKYFNNQLYVCDYADKCIYILDDSGKIINKIVYSEMKSPFDVNVLDDKIIVSDTLAHRVLQFDKNGQFYGLYGLEYDNKGAFISPISIVTSSDYIMVLDKSLNAIQIFNGDGQLVRTCDITSDIKAPIAIDYRDGINYLLDKENSKVVAYDMYGQIKYNWGKKGSKTGELLNPQDFCVYDNKVYIADSGNCRVQVFSLDGTFISQFGNIDQMVLPKSISVNATKIAVSDIALNRITIFDHNGNLLKTIGKKGSDIGSYLGISGINIDETDNIYIADSFNNRLQILNLNSLNSVTYGQFGTVFPQNSIQRGNIDFDYSLNIGKFSLPCDIAKFKENIIVVDKYNQRLQMIPLKDIYKDDAVYVSTSEITFGSFSPDTIKTFTIYSGNGAGLNATITSKDPLIKVDPSTFNSTYQQVKVSLSGPASGELEVNAQGKKFTVNIFCAAQDMPYFYLQGEDVVYAQDTTKIPIQAIKQNGFNSNISYQADLVPKNSHVTIEENDNNLFVKIAPSGQNKYLNSGTYPVKISATSGQIKQTLSFLLTVQQNTELVPHVVLGELFTATWCINCVHSHYSMDLLMAEMGKEKVNFIEYYVQSTDDHPKPALSNPESEQRMKWYKPEVGLPDFFIDGTDHLLGVSTAGDTSDEAKRKAMYESYKKKIEEKLQQPSLVSIQAKNIFDSSNNTGSCTAELRALDNLLFKDLRVYFVLIENNIPYKSMNGDKVHYFVNRDMITPANDGIKDYLGTPIKITKKGNYDEVTVNYPIKDLYNIDNLQMVVFVQDNVTKQVLQSTQADIKTIGNKDFEIVASNLYQQKTAGTMATFEVSTINTGSLPDHLSVGPTMRSGERFTEKVTLNIPSDAQVGSVITKKYIVSNSRGTIKSIDLTVEVIKDVPPDFEIVLEKDTYDLLAGDVQTIKFNVLPNPKFDQEISLSLQTDSTAIDCKQILQTSKMVPFTGEIEICFKNDTSDSVHKVDIVAKSGDITKTKTLTFNVSKNPRYVPPTITITSPVDNYITNNPKLTISGYTDGVKLTVNDIDIIVGDGNFDFQTDLTEGKNVFNFVARNSKDLISKATINVFLDTQKPEITVDKVPLNIFSDKLTINGKVNEQDIIFGYSINQMVFNIPDGLTFVKYNEVGNFTFTVDLKKGYNDINLVGLDKAGNLARVDLEVYSATKIVLQIGNQVATVNSKDFLLESSPYIKNGRTMVPIRFISEQLGATVEYTSVTQEINILYKEYTIRLTVGSKEAWVHEEGQTGDTKKTLEAAPEIVTGRTFVPIRFISETFNFTVLYDSKTQKITITNEIEE